MATIDVLIERLSAINMRSVVADSVEATKKDLAALQVDQMMHGKNAAGKIIGKYKNKKYKAQKQAKNPLANGNVDLNLTGQFQDEIEVIVQENYVTIISNDNTPVNFSDGSIGKTDKLVDQYGEIIFGLSTPYAKEYSGKYLTPVALKKIKGALRGQKV